MATFSGQLGALGVDVDGVERLTGSHEEAVSLGATETKVGARFWKMNLADKRTVGREYVDTVVAFSRPSGSGPDVAVRVAPDAIR